MKLKEVSIEAEAFDMVLKLLLFGLEVDALDLSLFLVIFATGAYLNWDWAKTASRYVTLEQKLYHPLIRRFEKESGNAISMFIEPRPLPFFDYVFHPKTTSFLKKVAWWIRSLFLLGLIAMDWWIVVLILIITREVPTKHRELISHGIHYKRYDNDFLLDALAYHLAFIAAVVIMIDSKFLEIVTRQIIGSSSIFGIQITILYGILLAWGVLYLVADFITILISIYDHRRWRTFWLQQFDRHETLRERFPDYLHYVQSSRFYPVDKKYVIGCVINIILLIIKLML